MLSAIGFGKVARLWERYAITPHHITTFAVVCAVAALYNLYVNPLLFSIAIILNMASDAIDGWYARYLGRETVVGEWFDHSVDFALGFSILIKSYLYFLEPWILALCIWYLIEMALILLWRLNREIFPPKIFILFFIFGAYRTGLIVDAYYTPLCFFGYLLLRYIHKRHQKIT